MTMIDKSLSLIIPAYNEEACIESTLRQCDEFLKKNFKEYEIVVVDNGSNDNTVAIVNDINRNAFNVKVLDNSAIKGKGATVKKGMLACESEYLLFSDADLSTPIEEVLKLVDALENGADIAIGSRAQKESRVEVPQGVLRNRMGKLFGILVQLFFGLGLKDSQCGFKLFKKEAAKKIISKQRLNGFSFDVEILLIAKKFGMTTKELGVRWLNRAASKLNPVTDSTRMLWELGIIKINELKGNYN